MKKKVLLVFGTRPEGIKCAPVIQALQNQEELDFEICVTGQHKEMLQQVLEIFQITSGENLAVMQEGQTLNALTARLLMSVEQYLEKVKPDLVLAIGDTTTALTTALACFHKKISFGHIEAGLRTYNLHAPWPEEANRQIVSRIATLHFAPTEHARQNLLKENIPESTVFLTGNTIVDALQFVVSSLPEYSAEIRAAIPDTLFTTKDRIVLITGHRRENFDGGIKRVCDAIRSLADTFPDVHFVYPVHLNPAVQSAVKDTMGTAHRNVHLLPPLSYVPFVWLMQKAHTIITDSGGIQEEAPSLGKPVLVTREITERPEGVEAGSALVVGTNTEHIIEEVTKLLTDGAHYASMAQVTNPYGDGTAAERIVTICNNYLYGKK